MTQNPNNSHNFSNNGSYIQSFIQNIDTQQNNPKPNNNNNINLQNNTKNPNQSDQESPNEAASRVQSSRNNFIKQATKTNQNHSNKSAFQLQLQQLQRKLFHQVVLKSQLASQTQFDRQVLRKLSESIKANLQDTLGDIQKTQQRLQNPLLNYLQKQEIKQTLLQLRMQELAHTKVLVNTYRHHQYRLVLSLLHIAQIYLQLKCHQQALNHLQNALSVNDVYRHVSKDVQYFHSLLLSFLGFAQFEVQSLNLSMENLNKALEIHEALKGDRYELRDFFSLNLVSKVLLCAGKGSEAISFGKMAIQSADTDYSSESIQYATACKTLAQALAAQHSFQSALQSLHTALRTLQVHHPSKQQTIIQFYQKLTQITLKKLTTPKPQHPAEDYFDEYLEVMREKYNVVENTYGYRDKRVIKEKRHLASSLLKYGKVNQAQQELQDILEIEQVVYGEKSVEVAKTLKLLGTVAMSLNQTTKAEKHLKKSMGIFHDQGQVNLEKQVQAKLLILTGKGKFLINNNNNSSGGKM